jgi:hypothetical protein
VLHKVAESFQSVEEIETVLAIGEPVIHEEFYFSMRFLRRISDY